MIDNGVAAPTAAVNLMADARALPDALISGTKGMRERSVQYLPKEVGESPQAYNVRLERSFLFPGYAKAVGDMADKVFAKPIVIGEDVPAQLATAMENVDLGGRNLNVFAKETFRDAIHAGISYILVDMDRTPVGSDGRRLTLSRAQSVEMQRRPWAVHIPAKQVIGWRSESVNGIERLTQFRFKERVTENDGPYGEKLVDQIRVLLREGDAVTWEIHRQQANGGWTLHDSGDVTIPEIAICPVYVNRVGFMAGVPPLASLADINLQHWQSQSDQRNILHVARVPILFGAGFPNNDTIEIGPYRMIRLSDPAAKLNYVEHSGAAIASGRQDLKDLEFQMQTLGLELLVPRPTAETATGAAIDQARMNTPLAMMAQALQDALEQMLGFMAVYEGIGPRDTAGGSLIVNTDFGVSLGSAEDGQILTQAVKDRIISRETWINEMKRRAVLSEDIDPEEEAQKALNEGFDDVEEETGGFTTPPA